MEIIRKIDELGRVCLPKSYRTQLNIGVGDEVSIDYSEELKCITIKSCNTKKPLTDKEMLSIKTLYDNAMTFGIVSEEDKAIIDNIIGE